SNAFPFGFLKEVEQREEDPNVFVSPLSASMALAMTTDGARGVTQDEMRTTLGFGEMTLEEINASYASLMDLLLRLDDSVDIRIANALWMRQGMAFYDYFVADAQEYYIAAT